MNEQPVILGDDNFIGQFAAAPDEEIDGIKQLQLSIDPQGNILGDTSHIPEHILAQLVTPQAMAQMREQYRASRYPAVEPSKKAGYINEREDRRLFIESKPKGMDSKEWRKLQREKIRKSRKAILKTHRSIHRG